MGRQTILYIKNVIKNFIKIGNLFLDNLQQMVVLSISPALMTIDSSRKTLCSFRTG
jgi:hypothetical protein